MELEINGLFFLLWAIVVSAIVIILVMKFSQLKQKHQIDILELKKQKETSAFNAGKNFLKGDSLQILGTFSFLNEYDDIILLSTTSRQASMDLIGINNEKMDVIEVKAKGNQSLSKNEKRIKRLVEEKKVNYRIVEAELPKDFKLKDKSSNE